MVQGGGTFGTFMSIGTAIRCWNFFSFRGKKEFYSISFLRMYFNSHKSTYAWIKWKLIPIYFNYMDIICCLELSIYEYISELMMFAWVWITPITSAWIHILATIIASIAIIIFISVHRQSLGISSENYQPIKNELPTNDQINKSQSEHEPKIVIDPGKALCQMVKFKVRFQRKVKRFRERKQMEKQLSGCSNEIE